MKDKTLYGCLLFAFFFQIIFSFYESKYGKCLKLLEEIKDNLLLDMYLSSHVGQLYSLIRNRGLVQYFRCVAR